MLLLVFIFIIITPVFCMDEEESFLPREWAVGRQRLLRADCVDEDILEAMQRSLNPVNNVDPKEFAMWMCDDEVPQKPDESPLGQLLRKAKQSPSELAFLWGLDPQNYFINLAGYMMLLKSRAPLKFDAVVRWGDKGEWAHVFNVLHLGQGTASNLFMLQDEVRDFFSKQPKTPTGIEEWIARMDVLSLDLVSGKWGFSRKKTTPAVIEKLQKGIEAIGRRMGMNGTSPRRLVSDIFRHFNNGMLAETVKDHFLRRYRLFVFSYIANGYLRTFPHGERETKLEILVKKANPFFPAKDREGFSMEDLLQNPKDILDKIDKASRLTFDQQVVFMRFLAPLTGIASEDELYDLKAFLSTFDLSFLDVEKEQRRLGLFQLALQDKTPDQISQMVTGLIDSGFLPEDIRDIEPILIEAAHYKEYPYDRIYGRSIEKIRVGKGGAEPEVWSKQRVLNQGLQLWLRDYFDTLYRDGYAKRNAYLVEYEGAIQGEMVERDAEVTEEQAVIASSHMAAYDIANQLKRELFPHIPTGQKAVFSLLEEGKARIDLVNEDDDKVVSTKELHSKLYSRLRFLGWTASPYSDRLSFLGETMSRYGANPNVLPAAVKRREIPSETPLKPYYAVRGGQGVSDLQKIQSRGRAIDALIRGGRIEHSLKLPILLYLHGW